jgi:hypothetical protein
VAISALNLCTSLFQASMFVFVSALFGAGSQFTLDRSKIKKWIVKHFVSTFSQNTEILTIHVQKVRFIVLRFKNRNDYFRYGVASAGKRIAVNDKGDSLTWNLGSLV